MNRLLSAAVAAASTALLITGCTKPHESNPESVAPDPSQIAGKPITEGPSGLRPDAPGPTRPIVNTDNGEIDHLAAMSIADIEEFWTGAYGEPLKGKFTPVNALFSYDFRYKHGTFCGSPTSWDQRRWCGKGPRKLPLGRFGVCTGGEHHRMGSRRTAARTACGGRRHGRHVHTRARIRTCDHVDGRSTQGRFVRSALASEQQADCFAGTYIRWVVDDKSPRFTLNTGKGLTKLLVAMIGSRDPLIPAFAPAVRDLYHGSAFDRVTAFQMGFTNGASACTAIDPTEIKQRRARLPKDLLEQGQTGEFPIAQDSVKRISTH